MKTTNLFVELVVVGTGAALSIVLFLYTFFKDNLLFGRILSDVPKPDDLASIIPVLSVIYVLGVVVDKIAYKMFRASEDGLRRNKFVKCSEGAYYAKRHSLYTSPNTTHAIEAFEYGRSKIRICRGWALNSILLIAALGCFMIFQNGWDVLILVGIVGFGLLASLTVWSWKTATDVELRWLERFPPGEIANAS
jgi:hypothetical protein